MYLTPISFCCNSDMLKNSHIIKTIHLIYCSVTVSHNNIDIPETVKLFFEKTNKSAKYRESERIITDYIYGGIHCK